MLLPLNTVSQQEHPQVSRLTSRVYSFHQTKAAANAKMGKMIGPAMPTMWGIHTNIPIDNILYVDECVSPSIEFAITVL